MPSKPGNSRRSSSMATSLSAVDQTPQPHVSVDGLGGASGANPEDAKYLIAHRFLATLLQEIVIDTALYAHSLTTRQKKCRGSLEGGCPVCRSSCQAEHHAQSAPAATSSANAGSGTEGTAANGASGEAASATATPQPKGLDIYHNNPLLACLVCSRQVSANRYAQHLASCVGVGKGGIARRKGKAGGAAKDRSKVKSALEARKRAGLSQSNGNGSRMGTPTPTPTATSDDEGGNRKSRSLADSLGVHNGKRTASASPGPKAKHARTGTPEGTGPSDSPPPTASSVPAAVLSAAANSSQPLTASPLNPNRYQSNTNAALAGSLKGKGSTGKEKKRKREDNEDEDGEDEDGEEADDDEEDDDDGADDADDDDDDEEEDDDDDESEADSDGNASSPDVPLGSSRPNDGLAKASTGLPLSQSGIERSKGSDGEYIDVESASAQSEPDDDF